MINWTQTVLGLLFIASIMVLDLFLFRERVLGPENMVWLAADRFTMGSDQGLPDERPAHEVRLTGFWIDRHEVTNSQFAAFVTATGHETRAESLGDSLVFAADKELPDRPGPLDWWRLVPHANWRQPQGMEDSIDGKEQHPVVHVSYDDARAYCEWAGKELPTEAQFEYAARAGREGALYSWGDAPLHRDHHVANTWQGDFPFHDDLVDGFASTAPVGSFEPNDFGLYDMGGNVWEWVSDWYHPDFYRMSPGANPTGVSKEESLDPNEPNLPKRSIRGGSFLCSDNYCAGFRVSARMPADPLSSSNHTGFRCVINRQRP